MSPIATITKGSSLEDTDVMWITEVPIQFRRVDTGDDDHSEFDIDQSDSIIS